MRDAQDDLEYLSKGLPPTKNKFDMVAMAEYWIKRCVEQEEKINDISRRLQDNGFEEAETNGVWRRITNAYGELESFMCECGRQSMEASNYCPNCGGKMMAKPTKTWKELQENLSYCNLYKRKGVTACYGCKEDCKHKK